MIHNVPAIYVGDELTNMWCICVICLRYQWPVSRLWPDTQTECCCVTVACYQRKLKQFSCGVTKTEISFRLVFTLDCDLRPPDCPRQWTLLSWTTQSTRLTTGGSRAFCILTFLSDVLSSWKAWFVISCSKLYTLGIMSQASYIQ